MAENLNVLNWEETFALSNIPVDLQFYNCSYKLLAVIEYKVTENAKTVGHYIAHIRRFTGRWEIHNNLCKNKQLLLASQRTLLQKKKIIFANIYKNIK